ncbi:NAD(P)/FAD-dependent oxidoreductase [Adhaeribacter aquaticus]|uniref:NAD(P)/FAD-dependent oxidoreductase n=1 Tax=Adhaeribacter aquaticus TaxID=299567 RepID=UPI000422B70F|nr:NAD(P)/FAD-dependent oxidoreductase [Adhaeribacter aquaticus]
MYDVTIIGGGPAGLSAALLLTRCMRKVILFDSGEYRNAYSNAMNGFISRDGTNPKEFLKLVRADLNKYKVDLKDRRIVKARRDNNLFEVTDSDNNIYLSRKLLIATGVKDRWPQIPGIEPFNGKSVHHCPYCDGWESRNKPLGAYGKGRDGFGLSLSLKTWSSDVTLFMDGIRNLRKEDAAVLERNHIKVVTAPIERVEGEGTELKRIVLKGGATIPCEALFFSTGHEQRSNLSIELGCDFTSKGVVRTYKNQQTNIPGLFVAGDAAREMQLVIVAASEGTKAGVMINKELQEEFRL